MPRTYVRKTLTKYTDEDVKKALEEVNRGCSVRSAAEKYNIPQATLRRNIFLL